MLKYYLCQNEILIASSRQTRELAETVFFRQAINNNEFF
jgi:hypothetical protein